MATKQITTWAEFKTALTENITENTTYEIMNDIDVSGEVLSSITATNNSFTKTFKPGGTLSSVSINGLTSYATSTAFALFVITASKKVTFTNIHFSNFMCQNLWLFNTGDAANTGAVFFNNCLFNGLCYGLYFGRSLTTIFNKCSVNIKCKYLSYRFPYFDDSYVIISPFSDNDTNSIVYEANTIGGFGTNSYLGGTVRNNRSGLRIYSSYDLCHPRSNNCVFNLKAEYTDATTSINVNNSDSGVSLVNNSHITNSRDTNITVTASGAIVPLTDTQLKSRTYIKENTNFPLYG